jgi:Acetyltransferase (GNAT) family
MPYAEQTFQNGEHVLCVNVPCQSSKQYYRQNEHLEKESIFYLYTYIVVHRTPQLHTTLMRQPAMYRSSTSLRCRQRAETAAMMVLVLLPLLSCSFQFYPKIPTRNLVPANLRQAVKGQDTIIQIVPTSEVAKSFIIMTNENGVNKAEEINSEYSEGPVDARDDHDDHAPELESDGDNNDGDESKELIRRKAMTSLLTSGAVGLRRSDPRSVRDTSVGSRRVGSASKGRAGLPKTSQLLTAVRRAANAAAKSVENSSNTAKTSQLAIGSAIETLLERRNAGMDYSKHTIPPMGILGAIDEAAMAVSHPLLQSPKPGTLLIKPQVEQSKAICKESLMVRVATLLDDTDIASLRLSVFSDFSPEMRKQFCSRSRQVLSNRRLRGATCLVATTPAQRRKDGRTDIVLGSIECSVHELYGTLLGRRRTENSVLYITEVAVNPLYRRCGIGSKLLEVRLCHSLSISLVSTLT